MAKKATKKTAAADFFIQGFGFLAVQPELNVDISFPHLSFSSFLFRRLICNRHIKTMPNSAPMRKPIAKNNALCIIKFLLSNEGFQGLSPDKQPLWYHKGDACWYIADLFSLRGRTFFETSRKQSQSSSLSAIQPPQAGQRCSHSLSG